MYIILDHLKKLLGPKSITVTPSRRLLIVFIHISDNG